MGPLLLLVLVLAATAPARTPDRVLGEIASANTAAGEFSVRTAGGRLYAVKLLPDARVMLVEPGERDLSNARPATAADLAPGDRAIVRGDIDHDAATVLASSLIIMSRSSIAGRRAREQADWRARSILGAVIGVDPAGATLRLNARANGGLREWTVAFLPTTTVRRYADTSVRFADSQPSTIAAIHPGDQLRVLGARDNENARVAAGQVVFGSFRTLGGEVVSVNAASGQIVLKDVQTRKRVTLAVAPTSTLRGMPATAAGLGPGMGRGARTGPPSGAPGPGGMPDLNMMLERLPPATLDAIKPGDAIIASIGRAYAPQPWPVISLLAGVGFLLRASAAQVNQVLGNWNVDMPMQ